MGHIHKQFSDDEVKQYLKWYEDGIQLHIIPSRELTEVRFLRNNTVLGYQQIPTPASLQF